MESVYKLWTSRALQIHDASRAEPHGHHRTLIALAGPPGSGKSTIAAEVVARLNSTPCLVSPEDHSAAPSAIVLPMDGFHLSRSSLDLLPNSVEAHARRGAAWTFDANGVVELIRKLRDSKATSDVILAPAFDHATKDPVPDAIMIPPSACTVIIEGNWLLYDADPWRNISELVDDTWFVDVDPVLARSRIASRHVRSGIESTWEDAIKRTEGNDLINGEEIRARLIKPNVVFKSVEEQGNDTSDIGQEEQVDGVTSRQPQSFGTIPDEVR